MSGRKALGSMVFAATLGACAATHPATTAGSMDGAGMVSIGGATFVMGKPDGVGDPWEHPQHRVTVPAFRLDRTEVTVNAYDACVRAGACEPAGKAQKGTDGAGPEQDAFCNGAHAERGNDPVNCIDWNQAAAYCAWAGKRLPTEEEWEYAAKGPDARTYPWGNDVPSDQLCWNRLTGDDYTHALGTCPVASHPSGASPFGTQDMAGNVWEWTATSWSRGYDKPGDPSARVVRGGGWRDGPKDAHVFAAASRNGSFVTDRVVNLGFRCAQG